mmetsp:Transcript_13075/g.29819  ORF Transcript_13075/g.29819 Transcript_13075/m.29819 type:complete len:257 (-) Transcript_13075:165-935(-)
MFGPYEIVTSSPASMGRVATICKFPVGTPLSRAMAVACVPTSALGCAAWFAMSRKGATANNSSVRAKLRDLTQAAAHNAPRRSTLSTSPSSWQSWLRSSRVVSTHVASASISSRSSGSISGMLYSSGAGSSPFSWHVYSSQKRPPPPSARSSSATADRIGHGSTYASRHAFVRLSFSTLACSPHGTPGMCIASSRSARMHKDSGTANIVSPSLRRRFAKSPRPFGPHLSSSLSCVNPIACDTSLSEVSKLSCGDEL